jgi:hypothetical protein
MEIIRMKLPIWVKLLMMISLSDIESCCLSGVALSWYTRLDNIKIWRWKDLVVAFIKQYKYTMNIALIESVCLI